jgi:hypothetical protein
MTIHDNQESSEAFLKSAHSSIVFVSLLVGGGGYRESG